MRSRHYSYLTARPLENIIQGIIYMIVCGGLFIFFLLDFFIKHRRNWFDFILFELMFAFFFCMGLEFFRYGIEKLSKGKTKSEKDDNN